MIRNALALCAGAACVIVACTSTSTRFGDDDDGDQGESGAGVDGGAPSGRSGNGGTLNAGESGSAGASTSGGSFTIGGAPGASGRNTNGGTDNSANAGNAAKAGNTADAGTSGAANGGEGGTETGASGSDSGGRGGSASTMPCSPNPCRNDGVCTTLGSSYRCECANGESGTNCEVPCNLTDVTIQFEDLAPAQLDKLAMSGVEIVGSGDLLFTVLGGSLDPSPGLGVLGGTADWLLDGSEFLSFRFARPARNVSYYVPSSMRNEESNDVWGESTIEAFNASGASLGTEVATDNGQKNVSLFFDDKPLSKFTIRPQDGDGIVLGNVRFAVCMTP